MMGKKDYQLFADAISLIQNLADRQRICDFLFPIFEQDNSRFDRERFREWIRRRDNNESMKGTGYNPKYMPLGVNV